MRLSLAIFLETPPLWSKIGIRDQDLVSVGRILRCSWCELQSHSVICVLYFRIRSTFTFISCSYNAYILLTTHALGKLLEDSHLHLMVRLNDMYRSIGCESRKYTWSALKYNISLSRRQAWFDCPNITKLILAAQLPNFTPLIYNTVPLKAMPSRADETFVCLKIMWHILHLRQAGKISRFSELWAVSKLLGNILAVRLSFTGNKSHLTVLNIVNDHIERRRPMIYTY